MESVNNSLKALNNGQTGITEHKQKIGICAVFACIYFVSVIFTSVPFLFGMSLLKAISLMIGAVFVAKLFLGDNKFSLNGFHLFFIIYLLYSFMSLLKLSVEYSVFQVRGMFEAFIIILLISMRIYNQREKRWIENSWIILGIIAGILGVRSETVVSAGRTTLAILGGYEDPNQFCAYFIIPLLLCIERLVKKEKFWYVYFLIIILMLFAIAKTGSRGGIIGVLIPIVAYLFFAVKGIKKKLYMIIFAVLAAIIVVNSILPMLPEDTRNRLNIESVKEDKASGRFGLWKLILDTVTSDWNAMLTGLGIGSTIQILQDAYSESEFAHNQWLQLLSDQGLVGIFLYLLVLGWLFIKTWNKKMVVFCALLGVVAFSMSLTFYTFKPVLNIFLMGAMSYKGELLYEN